MLAVAFGRWLTVIPGIPITLWPPNGVVLAMLLTQPRNTWIWWLGVGAAGELVGNFFWFRNPLAWAMGYVAANATAVTVAGVYLAPILGAPIKRFSTLAQVLAFLLIAVLGAPAISATIGSAIDAIVGKNAFATTWPLWWLGDATGILIATPLVISALNAWPEGIWPSALQLLEGLAIFLFLAGLSAWVLSTGAAYAFLLPLPILWASLRYEFRGAALSVVVLALAIGLHAQSIEAGGSSPVDVALSHARMQALLLVAATTGLVAAAIIRQLREVVWELEHTNKELETRVVERTQAIEAAEKRFRATFQNAGVAISLVSSDGKLIRVNDRMEEMLGYDRLEIEGHSIEEFSHPDDRLLGKAALDRLNSGEADDYELEKRYVRRSGEILWGHTTVSCVRQSGNQVAYFIKIIQDVTARKLAEDTRQILMREVNHRSKNLLTIVQVIARQTAARSPEDFTKAFSQRLQALASNQDLLVNSDWQSIPLHDLISSQVGHFADIGDRLKVVGPYLKVSPAAAQVLGMALHELATNAAKYGSLSNEAGRVETTWDIGEQTFTMSWREVCGPKVRIPGTRGFGSTVLERMTASSLSGDVIISFEPDGLIWRLRCPLSEIRDIRDT